MPSLWQNCYYLKMEKEKDSIILSPQHGLNPSILHCFICDKELGIVLLGKLKEDAEAPKDMYDGSLCEDCQKILDSGYSFVLEVRDGESGNNPYRTGRYVAVKKEALKIDSPCFYMVHSEFEELFGEFIKEQKEETKDAD